MTNSDATIRHPENSASPVGAVHANPAPYGDKTGPGDIMDSFTHLSDAEACANRCAKEDPGSAWRVRRSLQGSYSAWSDLF